MDMGNPQNIIVGDEVEVRIQGFFNNNFVRERVEDVRIIHGTLCAVFKSGWIALQGDGIRKIIT